MESKFKHRWIDCQYVDPGDPGDDPEDTPQYLRCEAEGWFIQRMIFHLAMSARGWSSWIIPDYRISPSW